MVKWILDNAETIQQYSVAGGIPVILIFLSAFVEKLCKGQHGWKWKYFYLGVDLTIAAMSSALVNLADSILPGGKSLPARASANSALYLVGTLFLLFLLMGFQQDHGAVENPNWKQIAVLVFASNLMATGVFFGFILLKLRGML